MSNDDHECTAQVVIVIRIVCVVIPFVVLAGLSYQCTIDGYQHTNSTHDADCTDKNCSTNSDDDRGLTCSDIYTLLLVFMLIDVNVLIVEWSCILWCTINRIRNKYKIRFLGAIFVWFLVEIGSAMSYFCIMTTIAEYDNDATRRRAALATFIVLIFMYSARPILIVFGPLFLDVIHGVSKLLTRMTNANAAAQGNETQLSLVQIQFLIDLLLEDLQSEDLIEQYNCDHAYWNFVCNLIKKTWLYSNNCGRDALGLTHRAIEVKRVFMVTNSGLRTVYDNNATQISSVADTAFPKMLTLKVKLEKGQHLRTTCTASDIDPFCLHVREDLQPGEVFLFHGTKIDNVDGIVRNGFDINRCVRYPYGKGIYLTDSSQKADQYSDNPEQRVNNNLAMFIVRTRLGQCRVYPCAANDGAPVDTIFAGLDNLYREYIATNVNYLYPEFLVIYDRV